MQACSRNQFSQRKSLSSMMSNNSPRSRGTTQPKTVLTNWTVGQPSRARKTDQRRAFENCDKSAKQESKTFERISSESDCEVGDEQAEILQTPSEQLHSY